MTVSPATVDSAIAGEPIGDEDTIGRAKFIDFMFPPPPTFELSSCNVSRIN
jgi:hypothetical protein